MSERPPNCDSRDVQRTVHERLHAKDNTSATHFGAAACCSYSLDTVVWETLAVLGEWELIQLGDLG